MDLIVKIKKTMEEERNNSFEFFYWKKLITNIIIKKNMYTQ